MGKNFRGRGKRGGDRGGDRGERTNAPWTSFNDEGGMLNEKFEAYYKGVIPEAEWDEFMAILKTELPTTFRVTGSRAHAETISNTIKDNYVPTMQAVEHDGKTYGPPEEIPWYPGKLAWQLSAPKRIVRKSEPFKVFQRFLVGETEVGNLSRQEAVSMIPPLLLDVEPHHIAMDMCAAPGSKTAQILEAMNPHHTSSTGLLIANDSDYKRTHMLVHQTGRMPSKGLIVTNCDASLYPHLKVGNDETLQFDRILADVPCSGDGTLRKNAEIWRKWGAGDGNGLHGLQLRILKRAMDMLKPGGRLVYSTCSFNPVENEAVIASALKARKEFSIVDVSSYLPALKRRPGITSWRVAFNAPEGVETKEGDAGMKWYDSYQAYQADPLPDRVQTKDPWKVVSESLWPVEGIEGMGLEKSLRLLPHDQNTGGFYVCVLHKSESAAPAPAPSASTSTSTTSGLKRALSPNAEDRGAKKEKTEASAEGTADVESVPASGAATPIPSAQADTTGKKKKQDWSYREDPFTYAPESDPELVSIVKYFKLKESFPRDTILVRNEEGKVVRVAYFTNQLVKALIIKDVLQQNDASKMRLIFAGVKGFVRQDAQNRTDIPCKWRIPSEGLPEVLPHLGDGIVRDMGEYGMETLRILVEHPYPSLDIFPKQVQEWFADPLASEGEGEAEGQGEGDKEGTGKLGNIIASFPAGEGHGGKLALGLVLPIWKAKTSLSLLIDKKEKSTLSLRTFGEDICRTVMTKKEREELEKGSAQEEGAKDGEEKEGEVKLEGGMQVDEEEGMNEDVSAPAVGQAEGAAAEL